ncbi:uncharacterized protein STEHIDRAFT_164435 [Stereum hirsutum FP-91666 SS1]|uniref:uncharacterized protein n=1 Tax=Stereum hirsutum (strain FP-91666) TaxID=721885 RepID=UPI000440C435|nr:uncharacterized protein STEHIDRAFT_164435 [Stereum hirsutum FP-91666 SS1]EIM92085.1 hypothetical protein STEHIDRAFT_164435 [Stereum hirsutum FP-91666 SS1]
MQFSTAFVILALAVSVSTAPTRRESSFALQNGQDAISQNEKFKTLTMADTCDTGDQACVGGDFAQCVNGAWVAQACGSGETCAALPLVNSKGTSITCDTQSDIDARIAATGATSFASSSAGAASTSTSSVAGGSTAAASATTSSTATKTGSSTAAAASSTSTDDAQNSLTLLSSVVATGFESDGQANATAGQVASLTSSNNFINFCATVDLPITNGQQITTGSCNPAPMGVIAASTNMPSSKFTSPKNLDTIQSNTDFNVSMAVKNLVTGNFVNAASNYYSAPQQVDDSGNVVGHTHIVIETLDSLTQTTVTDPTKFAFFKGVDGAAVNGEVTVAVTGGLPAGVYRMASINSAANHQPVLVAIAQRGALDDMIYFTVSDDPSAASSSAATSATAKSAATTTASSKSSTKTGSSSTSTSTSSASKD